MPGLLHDLLTDPEGTAFAVVRRASGPGVEVFVGDVVDVTHLADIPIPDASSGAAGPHVLAAVPYRQVTERGFASHDDGAPLRCLLVRRSEVLDTADALALLPDDEPAVTGLGFDVDDETYAATVRRVLEDEIGRGEGANFVIRRDYLGTATAPPAATVLRTLRRLLVDEPGAYWAFALHLGDLTMVGATPERHVGVTGDEVLMNPISGTYRFPPGGPDTEGLLQFLADPKETEELFMVVDEELKMMSRICLRGGEVRGPFLKQMGALAHTEYVLRGTTDLDLRDVLRETMFAPTVTGSPVQNAARVITTYESTGRGHYSGVLALFGRDDSGRHTLDAPIVIRTASIGGDGAVRVSVGATLVRHSVAEAEVAETHAKAAGVLRALGVVPPAARFGEPGLRLAADARVVQALGRRNDALADFWLQRQDEEPAGPLTGYSAVLVDADDAWTEMLAVLLRRLGMTATVTHWAGADDVDADLVVAGPGPGDPRDLHLPRVAGMHRLVARRLVEERPLLAVCLGHQVLALQLGLPVVALPTPYQGTQRVVDLFGRPARVGFYNTFTAQLPPGSRRPGPEVAVAAEPGSGDVVALRGPGFASVQFHPESLLSPDGARVLAELVGDVLGVPRPASAAGAPM